MKQDNFFLAILRIARVFASVYAFIFFIVGALLVGIGLYGIVVSITEKPQAGGGLVMIFAPAMVIFGCLLLSGLAFVRPLLKLNTKGILTMIGIFAAASFFIWITDGSPLIHQFNNIPQRIISAIYIWNSVFIALLTIIYALRPIQEE